MSCSLLMLKSNSRNASIFQVESEKSTVFRSRHGSGSAADILDPGNYLETVISSFPIKTEADIDRLNNIQNLIDKKMLEVASGGKRRPPAEGIKSSGGETNVEESRPPKKKKRMKAKRTMIVAKEQLVKAAVEKVVENRDKGRRKELIDMAKSALGGEKSKRKKRKEKERNEKSVEVKEEQRAIIPASTQIKFDWKGAILGILIKKGGRAKISKLRRKVLSSYQKQRDRGSKTDSELEAKFDKKLRRCKNLKMEKEYVLQVDGGNDCLVTDTDMLDESTAIPHVSNELREVCSTKAVKVEPVLPPPSPIPGPSRIGSPSRSPVHQRSVSIIRCRSRSPPPPSSPTRPDSVDTVVAPSPCSTSFEGGGASLRRSTRSSKSVSSYCYSPSSLGSDEDLICEAFSSGDDDNDEEFVPDHEDDDDDDGDDYVLNEDEVEATEEDKDCLRTCPSDVLIKEETKEIQIENDLGGAECPDNTHMEELPDSDESMDGKHRFVHQWIHDQGENGFGESVAKAETEGANHSKVASSFKT